MCLYSHHRKHRQQIIFCFGDFAIISQPISFVKHFFEFFQKSFLRVRLRRSHRLSARILYLMAISLSIYRINKFVLFFASISPHFAHLCAILSYPCLFMEGQPLFEPSRSLPYYICTSYAFFMCIRKKLRKHLATGLSLCYN